MEINRLSGTFTVTRPPAPPTPAALVPAAAPAPASFTISDLSVTPSEVEPAGQVTISALVANTGGSEGSYAVVLKINGIEEARQEVTPGPGKSETVTFTTTKCDAGTYNVQVNDLLGTFIVKAAELPSEEEKIIEEMQAKPINWWIIGCTVVGVMLLGLISYFLVRRRRKARLTKQ